MKYDFAHPRFRNGMVTFDEKKPDLLYEFRKTAAFHRYDVRNGNLYSPDKKQIATVYNRFDSVFIHMLKNKKIYRLSSKKDIDLFFNDIKESFNGDNNMNLIEAKEILNKNGYKLKENLTENFDRPFEEHEWAVAVRVKTKIDELQDYPYLYLDEDGIIIFNADEAPEFMDYDVACDVMANADFKDLEQQIEDYYGETAKVIKVFVTDDV